MPPSRSASSPSVPRILLFTDTKGFHHSSIPAAVAALRRLGVQHGFEATATSDPAVFNDTGLAGYRAVVFLLTSGDVLNDSQQAAFERFIARSEEQRLNSSH